MPKVKTITLNGGETAVKFSGSYPYYVITNMGDSELYASGNPGITAYADGVYTILPGAEVRISPEASRDTIYLFGSSMVQVRAEEIAVPTSFRAISKGGDKNNGDKHLIVDELPEVGNEKYTYLVPVDDFLSDNKYDEYIWANGEWEKVGTPTVNIITDYDDLTNKPIQNNVGIDNLSGKHTDNWYDFLCLQNIRGVFQCLLLITAQYNNSSVTESMLASVELSSPNNAAKFQILSGMGTNIFDSVKITSDNYYLDTLYYWNVQFHLADAYVNNRQNTKVRIELIFDPKQATDSNFAFWIFPNNSVPRQQSTRFSMNLDVTKPFSYNDLRDKPTIPDPVTIDTALSETSENPVQNRAITEALADKADKSEITQDNLGLVKDLGRVDGKTISEFKNLITTELQQLKTPISTLTLMASADINDLVNNWNNNDHIISGEENKRSRFQMTSIGSISTSQSYAVFIISSYYLTDVYCVTLSAGVFKPIKRLVFSDNIPLATGTTVGGIKSGGDISVASDGSVSVTSVKMTNLGDFYGKTIGDLKTAIKDWWKGTSLDHCLFCACFKGGSYEFDKLFLQGDNAVIPSNDRTIWQLTSIGSILPSNPKYGGFILSNIGLSKGSFLLSIDNGIVNKPVKLITSDDIRQDVIITDPNTNWDTLINNAVYYIELTADSSESSHPPFSGANWGMLEVFGQNGKTILYQRFTVSTTGLVYLRAKTAIGWNAWKLVAQPIS